MNSPTKPVRTPAAEEAGAPGMAAPVQPCPVKQEIERSSGLSDDLRRSLRRLRRSLENCGVCPGYEDCPTLQYLNAQMQAAIQCILDDWSQP